MVENMIRELRLVLFPEFIKSTESLIKIFDENNSNYNKKRYCIVGRYLDGCVLHLVELSDNPQYCDENKGLKIIGQLTKLNDNNKIAINFYYPYNHMAFISFEGEKIKIESKSSEIKYLQHNLTLSRLFIRVDSNEIPLGILNNKKIAIIGVGSGGSLIAVYLAKAGVKKFILIDDDIFEEHNIIRHIGSLSDVGRYKTHVVKDYILKRVPDVEIETFEEKFEIETKEDEKIWYERIKDVDLLIAATGSHVQYYVINWFIYKYEIPTIFVGTFEKIYGGAMIYVNPKEKTPCYYCMYGGDVNVIKEPKSDEVRVVYDRSLDDLYSQPGLGLDIDNVTIIASKFILSKLLNNVQHGLYRFDKQVYIWYNRDKPEDDVNALETYYIEIEKNDKCPICGVKTNTELSKNGGET